jgi:hypothetical protein
MTEEYRTDYPREPIGDGNPYYCCCSCGISDPQINGKLSGHAADCEWRRKQETKSEYNEETTDPRITKALGLAIEFGGIDGAHHKDWVIDQMVRVLSGDYYEELVRNAKDGAEGPDTYAWETGIAP